MKTSTGKAKLFYQVRSVGLEPSDVVLTGAAGQRPALRDARFPICHGSANQWGINKLYGFF
ncbi:hypothetical protein [Flavisolibacter nicotianae]|uniref:hypothetical protein n=1 Tax=Flavisolibacter nicotianae TaxID=2364882 RepID=UPI000EAFB5E5|nr:hypothetical protein [Flavisolibacter nicotianae]